jgi:ADP-heptose:LPS heptosyltransferase
MNPAIVISPLSNDPLRDWPLPRFRGVAELCVSELDAVVTFVGTREQRLSVNALLRDLPSDRYVNQCGRLSWDQTAKTIAQAHCVVANNSGIAHLAASLGTPVVSLFCASHSPLEWMARGRRVAVMTRRTVCSPCGIGKIEACPFDRRCFTDIEPALVVQQVARMLAS